MLFIVWIYYLFQLNIHLGIYNGRIDLFTIWSLRRKNIFCSWLFLSKRHFWLKNISVFRRFSTIKVIQDKKKSNFIHIVLSVWFLKTTFQWCNSFLACCKTLRLLWKLSPLSLSKELTWKTLPAKLIWTASMKVTPEQQGTHCSGNASNGI